MKKGIVPQKNQLDELLYDSRLLNKSLEKTLWKSHTIADVLQYCGQANLLCVADVVNYFFTIEMSEQSKTLLGFNFENKSLRWSRLPQGVSSSPQHAQMAMGIVLRNLGAIYFMDDIVLGHKSFEGLLDLFKHTLLRMRENNLRLRPDKLILFQKVAKCLGLIVTAGKCVQPDPKRFRPLLSLKYPKNAAHLKSVICFFSYYRRYISGFAVKVQKYNDMASEKIPFQWTSNDEDFIESLYTYLLEKATLALFDEKLPTKIAVDAAKFNVGCVLLQKRGAVYQPVGYYSNPIPTSKIPWSAFHKECLAFYEGVKYFQSELSLLDNFVVQTDCSSLRYLLSMDNPKPPFDRFICFLSQFSFTFEVISSSSN